jgi:hypothetical protein
MLSRLWSAVMTLAEVTLALFSLCNFLRIGSYLPQILRVANDNEGAKAISYWTWGMWIAANGSTAAYALVNVADWTLFIVSAMNTLGCLAVVGLTMWKRRRLAEAGCPRAPSPHAYATRLFAFTPRAPRPSPRSRAAPARRDTSAASG